MEWVEAPAPKQKRDDWMNEEQFVATLSKTEMLAGSSREKKRAAQLEIIEKEEEVKRQRELNPHWKDNGSGLPEEESNVESLRLPSSSVGDGGYGYLKKAYLRIQEQAQTEGRSMEEIAVERWGSLEKLVSMIDEAEARMNSHSKSKFSSDPRWRRQDFKVRGDSKSSQFRKPSHHRHSPSPERSFQYRKPDSSERHRKKHFNVSSSRRKRDPDSTSDWRAADDDSPPSSHSDTVTRSLSKGRMDVETSHEPSERSHVPAWKKVVNSEESKKQISKDSCTSKPSSSGKASYECVDVREGEEKRLASEPRSITSEDDLNRLAAKCMKAELMGDQALAATLKAELEEAREAFKSGKTSSIRPSAREHQRVLLTKMDSSGYQRPIQSSREDAGFERRTHKKQRQSNKYFDDSSKYSLKQMFDREKLTTADDNIEMFMDVAGEAKDAMNDEETSGISKKAMHKMAHGVQEEKDIGKAIRQHQKMSAALERCEYCLDQPNMKRHLIVTLFEEVYLCIPNYHSLTEGQCLIVPKRHVSSFLALEEDEWRSFEELKNLLRSFFRQQQKRMLCVETSMNFGRCPHAVIECIPVSEEDADMAPLYFKKAILESEEEWAHNVKLVDLTKKGIRCSVPKNLPYFWIAFDPAAHGGYAHVIEDEKCFPRNFGKEVIGGMLDIDYNYLYKNRKDDPLKKSNEAVEFTKVFEKFQKENPDLLSDDL